jgi:cell division septal protein FtsQ
VDDLDPYCTESQREWKRWADSGYRKRYQPRSIRRALAIVFTVLAVGIVAIFWLSATGRLP